MAGHPYQVLGQVEDGIGWGGREGNGIEHLWAVMTHVATSNLPSGYILLSLPMVETEAQ